MMKRRRRRGTMMSVIMRMSMMMRLSMSRMMMMMMMIMGMMKRLRMIPADGLCSWLPSWVSSREVKPEMYLVKFCIWYHPFNFHSNICCILWRKKSNVSHYYIMFSYFLFHIFMFSFNNDLTNSHFGISSLPGKWREGGRKLVEGWRRWKVKIGIIVIIVMVDENRRNCRHWESSILILTMIRVGMMIMRMIIMVIVRMVMRRQIWQIQIQKNHLSGVFMQVSGFSTSNRQF